MLLSNDSNSSVISFRRYEYKYLISPELMNPIRKFLLSYCYLDPFAHKEPDEFYAVQNLYLDSADYRAYQDAQLEAPSRLKLRIRAYGRDPAALTKFEIKRRFNDVCYKTSVKVCHKTWPGLLDPQGFPSIDTVTRMANPSLRRFMALAHSLHAEPKMLIRYERQAFQSKIDRYVRITFDRRICHQPKDTYGLRAQPGNWVCSNAGDSGDVEPYVILELKMMAHPPIWVMELLRRFQLISRGYSKYCTAVTSILSNQPRLEGVALTCSAQRS